ncbi:unnamed protein product, partial [Ectocarpus sp. 12 AP-2014]
WKFSSNWDTKADLSRWYGVYVNEDGRVVELWLSTNNLEGPLPEAVGALTGLKYLGLNDNKLTGPIPEALGALKELAHLRLSFNKLTGSVPTCLGSLSKLRVLTLGGNQLVGGPAEGEGLDSWRARMRLTTPQTLKQFPMSSEDRAALVALFRSTGGTRWHQKACWDTDADLSRWYGVEVNDHGRVVELILNYNNLQ